MTEFSDGRLLALPVMSEAQAKAAAAEDEAPGRPEGAPKAKAKPEAAAAEPATPTDLPEIEEAPESPEA